MNRIFVFCFLLGFCALSGKAVYLIKEGFSPRKIQASGFTKDSCLSTEMLKILDQSYVYLARGRQCFAFASEDGKYVLKIPRTDIYKTPLWVKALAPNGLREKIEKEHVQRKAFTFESFRIAFEDLKEETATIALHLERCKEQKQIKLIDHSGYPFYIALGEMPFILQYKRPLLMKELKKALKAKNEERAHQILKALVQVISQRAEKGILNRDRSFLRNYGFDGKRAYQIDIGSFFKDPCLNDKKSFEKSSQDSLDPIIEWVSLNYPSLNYYINYLIQDFI